MSKVSLLVISGKAGIYTWVCPTPNHYAITWPHSPFSPFFKLLLPWFKGPNLTSVSSKFSGCLVSSSFAGFFALSFSCGYSVGFSPQRSHLSLTCIVPWVISFISLALTMNWLMWWLRSAFPDPDLSQLALESLIRCYRGALNSKQNWNHPHVSNIYSSSWSLCS